MQTWSPFGRNAESTSFGSGFAIERPSVERNSERSLRVRVLNRLALEQGLRLPGGTHDDLELARLIHGGDKVALRALAHPDGEDIEDPFGTVGTRPSDTFLCLVPIDRNDRKRSGEPKDELSGKIDEGFLGVFFQSRERNLAKRVPEAGREFTHDFFWGHGRVDEASHAGIQCQVLVDREYRRGRIVLPSMAAKTHFPTRTDLEFYRSKQPVPAWVQKIDPQPKMPFSEPTALIDVVIAAHARIRPSSGEMAADNLLAIVRSWRRRGLNLAAKLQVISKNPECAINPEKRAAFARKWALRLVEIEQ